jgi:hypothetical protein
MGREMRRAPSERNLALVAYRDAGHTIRETAEKFCIGPQRVRQLELQTRDYQQAHAELREDPGNLLLLARAGRLISSAARALAADGIYRLDQLQGVTFRDLIRTPNMGYAGADEIVRLAAERGIKIK